MIEPIFEAPLERPRHYPGPWRVFTADNGKVWIEEVGPGERFVVADIPGDMETIEGEELANANLIAAAPDLLAALEEVIEFVKEQDEDLGYNCWPKARQAIKDAREGKEHVHE